MDDRLPLVWSTYMTAFDTRCSLMRRGESTSRRARLMAWHFTSHVRVFDSFKAHAVHSCVQTALRGPAEMRAKLRLVPTARTKTMSGRPRPAGGSGRASAEVAAAAAAAAAEAAAGSAAIHAMTQSRCKRVSVG